jgi:hypothetical protein
MTIVPSRIISPLVRSFLRILWLIDVKLYLDHHAIEQAT